jgi:hypothetical protein
MSFWYWHGAYVQSKSQAEIVEGIQTTMSMITQGRMLLGRERFNPGYFFSVGDLNLLFVSPQQENWTAFFGGGPPAFCTRVFETCHYSGLLIGGLDDDLLSEYSQRNSWTYMIWKEGAIVDWFVSNLSVYFDSEFWSKQSITRVVQPYLRRLGFDISDLSKNTYLLSDPDNKYAQAFRGNLLELRNYTWPEVNDETVKNWLALLAREALAKAPEVLNIPFSGSVYEMDDIAIYHDVERGLRSPHPKDNQDTYYQDMYNRSLQLHRIAEFEPVLFNKVNPSETVILPFEGFWF